MTIRVRIAWGEGPELLLMKMAGLSVAGHLAAIIVFSIIPRFTEAPPAPRATIAEIVPASSLFPPGPRGAPPAAAKQESSPSQRAEAAKEAAKPPVIKKEEPPKPVKKTDNRVPPPPDTKKHVEPAHTAEPQPVTGPPEKQPEPEPAGPASSQGIPAGVTLGGGAGPGGIPSLGSSAFPYDYYRSSLVAILQSNWRRPVAPEGLREPVSCRVQFTIMKSGIVQDARISAPSGNDALDQSALRAVYDSTPLPPLPIQYGNASVSAEVMFELTPD